MLKKLGRFAGPAVLLAITIGFYWKLTLTNQYLWFDQLDMSYLELPRMEFQAREMDRGRFPLWDPYIWCGQPLLGQTQPGPVFPLNLLFLALPLDAHGYIRPGTLDWYFTLVHFLAALFAYGLCRELRLSRAAAILGACIFSFGGFMGSVPWTDVMNGAFLVPLVLMYLLRTVRGERLARNAALCGVSLGVSWLSGHHEVPLMLSALVAGSWVWFAWQNYRLARYAALSFVIAGLVAAVQLWPTWEFAQLSKRFVGAEREADWNSRIPYTVHTAYSLPAGGVIETMLPSANTHMFISPFLGAVAVSLALLGLAAKRDDRLVRWIAAAGGLALLFAMGAATPLHGLIYALSPMLARARVPVRAILFFNLAAAVLAAYGLQSLLTRTSPSWTRRIAWFMASLAALGLGVASFLMYRGPAAPDRLWLSALCLAAASVVLFACRRGQLCAASLLSLVLIELTPFATDWLPHVSEGNQVKHASALFRNHDIAEFLRAQPDRIRTAFNDLDVPENFGDWHAIEMLQGYVAGAPTNLLEAYMHTDRFRQLAGVTHYVGKEPYRQDQVAIFQGASGIKVFRVPDAMPRAWAVHNAVSVRTTAEGSAMVQDPQFDFRTTAAVVGGAPVLESCTGDRVSVYRHAANRVTIRTEMACRGMVVLGDAYYPGWRGKVDGRAVPIHSAYGAFRGVVVEAGTHEIDMRYLPLSALAGGALTFVGLFAAAVCVWRSR